MEQLALLENREKVLLNLRKLEDLAKWHLERGDEKQASEVQHTINNIKGILDI